MTLHIIINAKTNTRVQAENLMVFFLAKFKINSLENKSSTYFQFCHECGTKYHTFTANS